MDEASLHEHIVVTAAQIAETVARVSREILATYAVDDDLCLIGILEGARPFTLDLHRALITHNANPQRRISVEWIAASSYHGGTKSTGRVDLGNISTLLTRGRHIIVVDDIIDEGYTLAAVVQAMRPAEPASLRVCVLLNKPSARTRAIVPDFIGLVAPQAFIVGYGLDYQEKYRNLPYLAALQPAALE